VFPNAATLQEGENLGRLNVSTIDGDTDGDGDYDALYAYGGRSFSIRSANGDLVFDSGSRLENITARLLPEAFNSDNAENDSLDSRSDNKGPEPEGVTVGRVDGRTYAFVGLERIGGVAVFDVSQPQAPFFVQYTPLPRPISRRRAIRWSAADWTTSTSAWWRRSSTGGASTSSTSSPPRTRRAVRRRIHPRRCAMATTSSAGRVPA